MRNLILFFFIFSSLTASAQILPKVEAKKIFAYVSAQYTTAHVPLTAKSFTSKEYVDSVLAANPSLSTGQITQVRQIAHDTLTAYANDFKAGKNQAIDTVRVNGALQLTFSTPDTYNQSDTLTAAVAVNGGGFDLTLGKTTDRIGQAAINAAGVTLSSNTTNTVVLDAFDATISSGRYVKLQGQVLHKFYTTTIPDANFTIPSGYTIIKLPAITADRTLTPIATTGAMTILINTNTSGFHWVIGANFKDAGGTTLTNVTNAVTTVIVYDGTNYIKIN